MTMTRITAAALMLFGASGLAAQTSDMDQGWIRLGNTQGGEVLFVSTKSLAEAQPSSTNNLIWIHSDNRSQANHNYEQIRVLYSFNCADRTIRPVQHTGYEKGGNTSTTKLPPEDLYPAPGTVFGDLMEGICKPT